MNGVNMSEPHMFWSFDMRSSLALLSAFLTLMGTSAFAAGVLLPSNNTAAPLPNLGLMPREQETSDKAPAVQTQKPQQPVPAGTATALTEESEADAALSDAYAKKLLEKLAPQTEAPAFYYKPVQSNITPGGTVAKGVLTDQEKLMNRLLANGTQPAAVKPRNAYEQKIQDYVKAQEESRKSDPTFIDDMPILMDANAQYPASLNISLSPNYFWGTNDIQLIERVLGYNAQTIPSQCQLRLRATVETNQGVASFRSDIHTGRNETIGYAGLVKSISLRPYAVCNPPRSLPRNGGIIMRTGDKYTLQLMGMGSCSPAPNQSIGRTLEIQYMGDSKVTCKFGG